MGSDLLSAIANLVMASAASAGAIAAFIGLNTWKKQGIWQTDAELSRQILIALYRYRDSLYSVRHPAMSESEMKFEPEIEMTADEARASGIINAYANRWEKHSEHRYNLDALLIEADAVWGGELSGRVSRLKELERELHAYISLFLQATYRKTGEAQNEYNRILRSKRDILYDPLDDDGDEFRRDFIEALEAAEDYLKQKLGRRK